MAKLRQFFRTLVAWQIPLLLLLISIAAFSSSTLLMRAANSYFYDRFARMDTRLSLIADRVLLVYADAALGDDPEQYLGLLDELRQLGATGFGIAQLDGKSWSEPTWRRVAEAEDVVLGDAHSPRAAAMGTQYASLQLPAGIDGVCRSYRIRDDRGRWTLAAALAGRFHQRDELLSDTFGIAFRGGVESLPHVSAASVLGREISAPLVRNRIVLIGQPSDAWHSGVVTPTTGAQRMSMLELHGHALNSLLNHRAIQTIPWPIELVLHCLAASVLLSVGRRTRLAQAILVLGAVGAVQAVMAMVLLSQFDLWIPLASLLSVQVAACMWNFEQRLRFSEQAWQVLRQHGFTVSPRYRNHFCLDPRTEPWPHLLDFVQHLFPVDRIALLVSEPARSRLRLAGLVGCEASELVERGVDPRRSPFCDAADSKAPLRIDELRPYFERRPDQVQFLVPLSDAGGLQGFLVVELSRTAWHKLAGFVDLLRHVGDEAASWVTKYKALRAASQRQQRWWSKWTLRREEDAFEMLQHHLACIERRMHQSYEVIENATSGKAVFDLGGCVVTINAAMFRLFHRFGIASADARLLPTLRTLSKRDVLECRELIRRVLIQGRRERVIIANRTGEDPMVLVVSPLPRCPSLHHDDTTVQAFGAQGIQFEVFEGSLLHDLHCVREHVTDQGLATLEEMLSDIVSLADEFSASDQDVTRKQLQASLSQAWHTVRNCHAMLANGHSESLHYCVPLQVDMVLRAAIAEVRPLVEKQAASIEYSFARDLPDVHANAHRLRQAMMIAIEALLEHARDNSVINISAVCHPGNVTVTMRNEGCGVALDHLAAVRRARPDRPATTASRLYELTGWLRAWGGELSVHSELGEGAVIDFVLPRFQWTFHCSHHPAVPTLLQRLG